MNRVVMVVDIDRCWGCRACQVACKYAHGLSAEDGKPIEVLRVETQMGDSVVVCDFVPALCFHCEEPECVKACPVDAMCRDEEGLIQVNEERCIGCGRCVKACAYGAVSLCSKGDKRKKAAKCDLCAERRTRGYLCSCEQHCLGNVFMCCPEVELQQWIGSRYSHRIGQIVYVSDRIRSLGQRLYTESSFPVGK